MNLPIRLQVELFHLIEFLAAFAVAGWLSRIWAREPTLSAIRLIKHRERFWLAIAFAVSPAILSALFDWALLRLYTAEGWAFLRMPISILLTVVYGALLGFAASCCASAPASARFRLGSAVAICAALILIPHLIALFAPAGPYFFYTGIRIVVSVAVIVLARLTLGEKESDSGNPATGRAPRSVTPALIIGFTPSALILAAGAFSTAANLPRSESDGLLWLCSGISAICCFTASIMLFTRNSAAAITGGVMFLLLNGFIAFFFGCCASLRF